jgi:predicted ATP-grasp superfamily ATP-dependent carboligase
VRLCRLRAIVWWPWEAGEIQLARILMLDGHSAAALAFVRSLGRRGHWVAVGSDRGSFAQAALSRYCRAAWQYPISTDEADRFLEAVLDFARRQSIELIIPGTDSTLLPLSLNRTEFQNVCRLALPGHQALELTSDKYKTIELARQAGVPVPATVLVKSRDELTLLGEFKCPAVVKDRFSARWQGNRAVVGTTSYAYSREELAEKVSERLAACSDVLVQEFSGGTGIGFSCFVAAGQIYLPFEWQRIREVDPRGSGSSARKSVALDLQILEFSRSLILRAGFDGIKMVEFKRDPKTGNAYLMEINGRPWGSLGLPIACGIDYPNWLANWCLGGTLPPKDIQYKKGVVCRRLVGELTHLLNVRAGRPENWPARYPSFWSTLIRVAVPWYPGMCYDDLSWRDPWPGFAGVGHWLRERVMTRVSKY